MIKLGADINGQIVINKDIYNKIFDGQNYSIYSNSITLFFNKSVYNLTIKNIKINSTANGIIFYDKSDNVTIINCTILGGILSFNNLSNLKIVNNNFTSFDFFGDSNQLYIKNNNYNDISFYGNTKNQLVLDNIGDFRAFGKCSNITLIYGVSKSLEFFDDCKNISIKNYYFNKKL